MPVIYIIRGIPGVGKSTLAKTIMRGIIGHSVHCEADKYFVGREFDPNMLGAAHAKCLRDAKEAIAMGFNVIVSNTFVKQWEINPYRELAHGYKIPCIEITVKGKNGFKSIHNVPEHTIARMECNFED